VATAAAGAQRAEKRSSAKAVVARDDMAAVLSALRTIRVPGAGWDEPRIHALVGEALAAAGIAAAHEPRIGPRMRPDFLTAGRTAIEIKKGRPRAVTALAQIARYAGSHLVAAVILVPERGLPEVPSEIGGKPAAQLPLYAGWGIAV
jgi:hypothetical protein